MDQKSILVTPLSNPTFFQFQEEERYRIARAIMEGPGQILANTLMELEHALALLDTNPSSVKNGLSSLEAEVRGGLDSLKAYVSGLQPPLLDELGLAACLRQYATDFGERNGIAIECEGLAALQERLPQTIETAIFRIVQEALANIVAHSKATRARIHVRREGAEFIVEVEDNGRGFTKDPCSPKRRQLGLVAMQDRAQLVGGHLEVYSKAERGLRVIATIPYHGHAEDQADGGNNEKRFESQNARKANRRRKRAVAPAGSQARREKARDR